MIEKYLGFVVPLKVLGAILIFCLGSPLRAQNQEQWIDCNGTMTTSDTKTVYSSFGEYLAKLGPIGTVHVNGYCREDVTIWGGDNFIVLGPAQVAGNISIGNSPDSVFLSKLTVTNSKGDGIDVNGSKLILDSCNVSNNVGNGVSVDNASHVVVLGTGIFNNNEGWAGGFRVFGHSFLNVSPSGPVEIKGNTNSGIWASESDVQIGWKTLISGNKTGPGVVLLGGTRAQFGGDLNTPSVIENNPNGGILLRENSEISLYGWIVRSNGQFGISSGFHSQVTLASAQVNENTGPGLSIESGSQLDFYPGTPNRVYGNGTLSDPMSAGVRIDGNSTAYLRGGTLSTNLGPGIRVGLNSTADFAGVEFFANSSVIACDLTSAIATDLLVPLSTGCITIRRNR